MLEGTGGDWIAATRRLAAEVRVGRRAFLGGALALALGPALRALALAAPRTAGYSARVAILYGVLNFELVGRIDESVDHGGGRYDVHAEGQGAGISNRVESSGVLREGRWAPVRTLSLFLVHGRESRSEVSYDHARRRIEYHSRSETFFLRRLRVADDVVPMPEGTQVDDVMSATLNYAERRWAPQPDGTLVTQVVRRRRGLREGPDDVEPAYRAELVPFVLRVTTDAGTGKPTALFDLTRFSSWAREAEPARIVFGPDRRPELVTSSLILGTSVTVRIGNGGA